MPSRDDEILKAIIKKVGVGSMGARRSNDGIVWSLNYFRCGLGKLPPEIAELQNLQELDLSANRLTSLPPEIAELQNLEWLDLSDNALRAMPPEIAQLQSLEWLDLSDNQLTALPPEIAELQNLQWVGLSYNQLTALPPEIAQLQNLQKLNLSGNQLTALPPEIKQLQSLHELDLSGNQLTALPPEIAQLQNLQKLNLSGNQLTALPPEIAQLQYLELLYLTRNRLMALPPEIAQLQNLQTIALSHNQLKALPPEIAQLQNLRWLDLRSNQLTTLPSEIARLRKLEELHLDNNLYLKIPPPEVVKEGVTAIQDYFQRLAAGKVRRYEAKLVIVGQGKVGKTCLSRALRELPFVPQLKTSGVEVNNWTFIHPSLKKQKITLRIWDFEGQDIAHTTHQFFLTGRSLYLLVFNARLGSDVGRIPYWLETIRARAPKCEVILVAAECAECIPKLDYQSLKERFKQQLVHEDYFWIDSRTGLGIEELKKHIAQRASRLDLMGHEWPKSDMDIEKNIESLGAQGTAHTRRQNLQTLMTEAGVDTTQHEALARTLGDLGTITHFPDSMYLNDLIVLNPQWLTGAISAALEDERLEKSGGYLEHHWLTDLWEKRYPALVPTFHRCMEEFEICYPIDGDNTRSLVPLRFRPQKPTIPWKDDPTLLTRNVRYHFQFIPAGVMARFIVKTHRMIVKTADQPYGVFWENGVFLQKDNAQALCEHNPDARTIMFEVRSLYPQSFMEQLCGYLESILEPYKGLNPEKTVGCIGDPTRLPKCAGEFSYDQLMYAMAKEPYTISCSKGWHEVDARILVTGLTSFSREIDRSQRIDESTKRILRELTDVKEVVYRIDAATREIVEHQQRDFVVMLTFIDKAVTEICPAVVAITAADRKPLDPRTWFDRKYRLRLYCQAEEGIHPVGRTYEFSVSREWWLAIGPYAKRFLGILKSVAGPAVAALPLYLNQVEWQIMKDDFQLMEELVKVLDVPEVKDRASQYLPGFSAGEYHQFEGAALRGLKAVLESVDPNGEWGGLQRWPTPDGKFLWLCEKHYTKLERPTPSYERPQKKK
ncbi:MAG TPA: COR domain-containing protein [Candidatus Deferrimicrobium sp.]|nr:COR domain-containing protein [Candidatus Deferrimicrobium sp.]